MAVKETIQLLEPYVEEAEGPLHLSSLFRVPTNGIHNKAKVEVHVRRATKSVAFPMRDPSLGYRMNQRKGFSIKELAPAAYKEGLAISADELAMGRSFGRTPYENPALMTRLQEEIAPVAIDLRSMILRGTEIQASQIFQTCALSILDDEGNVVFSENFAPKSSHFPVAAIPWTTTATAVPLIDIADACDVIVTDGRKMPMRVHMNSIGFEDMKNTDSFKAGIAKNQTGEIYRLHTDRDPVYPKPSGGGGIFKGVLEVRKYLLDVYVYDGSYDDPQTGADTKYIADNKCIIEAGGRMDATFGQINKFASDPRAAALLRAGRMTNRNLLSDLSYNMWFNENFEVWNLGIGTRALLYPVATDTFACITTK